MARTKDQERADELLPDGLDATLRRLRYRERLSFHKIARHIAQATNGQVDVTDRTISNWVLEMEARDAHPAPAEGGAA